MPSWKSNTTLPPQTLSLVTTKTLESSRNHTAEPQLQWANAKGSNGICSVKRCIHPNLRMQMGEWWRKPTRPSHSFPTVAALNSGQRCIIWLAVRGNENALLGPWRKFCLEQHWKIQRTPKGFLGSICIRTNQAPRLRQPPLYPLVDWNHRANLVLLPNISKMRKCLGQRQWHHEDKSDQKLTMQSVLLQYNTSCRFFSRSRSKTKAYLAGITIRGTSPCRLNLSTQVVNIWGYKLLMGQFPMRRN